MTRSIGTRAFALTLSALLAAFAVKAQESTARADAAQNGGAVAVDNTPKYNAGLNGRVKPAETKVRAAVAQNGAEAAGGAHTQPKYNSALSGRAGAAPTTLAESRNTAKSTD